MDNRHISAALLAGVLALAGCGGGSDNTTMAPPPENGTGNTGSMPDGDGMDEDDGNGDGAMDDDAMDDGAMDDKDMEDMAGEYKSITPMGANVSVDTGGLSAGRIAAGASRTVPNSNVTIKCEGDEDCTYRVTNTGDIQATGQATASIPSIPAPAAPPEDGNWLSASSLVGAIPATIPAGGTGPLAVTINGVKRTVTGNKLAEPADVMAEVKVNGAGVVAGTSVVPVTGAQLTGTGIDRLWLRHDRGAANDPDFLVWGAWIDAGTAAVPSPVPEQTFGGSIPHGAPTKTAGSATYDGTAHGFYKAGSGSWENWTGGAELKANFATQKVSGTIAHIATDDDAAASVSVDAGDLIDFRPSESGAPPVIGDHVARINLGMADMGASLGGKATIRGSTTTRNAPSSGTWNGAFFGPATGDPTGVAGSFSARRPAAKATPAGTIPSRAHDAVDSFEINGAFGAEKSSP